ncbi:DNA polymerase epsilon subunit 2, partial [Trichinella pseudospiralis]
LCGFQGSLKSTVIVGMMSQLKHHTFHLEDLTGDIEMNLTDTNFQPGLYVENMIVMVEGFVSDSVLHATTIGFPPIESAEQSLNHLDNMDLFGGQKEIQELNLNELSQLEQTFEAMFIFLSDIFLDSSKVLKALNCLFDGFAENDPSQVLFFVFAGEFLSEYYGIQQASVLHDGFKALADIVANYPNLTKRAQFIFIPSSADATTIVTFCGCAIQIKSAKLYIGNESLSNSLFVSQNCCFSRRYCISNLSEQLLHAE